MSSIWIVRGPGGERFIQRFKCDAELEAKRMNGYYQRQTGINRDVYSIEENSFQTKPELERILGFGVSDFTYRDWIGNDLQF